MEIYEQQLPDGLLARRLSRERLCSDSVVSVLDLMSFKWQASADLFDSNTAYIFCETNALLPQFTPHLQSAVTRVLQYVIHYVKSLQSCKTPCTDIKTLKNK